MGLLSSLRSPSMSATEAFAGLAGGDFVLVDVRERPEFGSERIGGARHMALTHLDPSALAADQRYLVICHSGARSAIATRSLRKAGLDATNVRGGMIAWRRAQLPLDRGKPNRSDQDRSRRATA